MGELRVCTNDIIALVSRDNNLVSKDNIIGSNLHMPIDHKGVLYRYIL